jgi:hypothetical protein
MAGDRTEFFVWTHEKDEVRLSPDGDAWTVCHTASTRLSGPSQVFYEATHRRATLAAWDVMARVIRATRDEDEGVRVGRSAARWMREQGSRG